MDEEFRRIPGWPQYFISRSGMVKRMQTRGRKPLVRPNEDGDLEIVLKTDQTRFVGGGTRFKVDDLVNMAWPEERGNDV